MMWPSVNSLLSGAMAIVRNPKKKQAEGMEEPECWVKGQT